MASDAGYQVVGLKGLARGLREMGDGLDTEFRRELRGVLGPIVADARARFEALPGTGPRTARTVRGSVTQSGIAVQMGGRGGKGSGFELGREFGAKGPKTRTYQLRGKKVTRTFDYSKPLVFDKWTGNQFSVDGGQVSGRAFYPAAAEGFDRAVDAAAVVVDRFFDRIVAAGD